MIFALIMLHGVLVGAEAALVSLRRSQLRDLVEQGDERAITLENLRARPERLIFTVQLGVTAIATAAGALGAVFLTPRWVPAFESFLPRTEWAHPVALGAVVLLITLSCVTFGEILPTTLAVNASTETLLRLSGPLRWLSRMAKPFAWIIDHSALATARRWHHQKADMPETPKAREDLRDMVDEAQRNGMVHPRAAEIASRALFFGELTVADVMVPRNQIKAVPLDSSPEEVQRILLEEGHSRMPVYDGTLDNMVGILVAKDVLALAWERELIVLQDLLQPAYFAPEIMQAADLLKELQRRRMHMAMAVDELGGTAGIVTLEDLLEELVGEIFGEHDKEEPELAHLEADGTVTVQGLMPVREANRELDLELPEGDEFSTIGGLCVSLAGRIPETGAKLTCDDGTTLDIIDASPRRVRLVRLRRPPSTPRYHGEGAQPLTT